MTFEEYEVNRLNKTNKGKYVICESREGFGSRMFIRTVTNVFTDGMRKKGWWDTFTISTHEVSLGLWLCSVVEYKLDKNNYINLIVEPITPVPELKFHVLFGNLDGTWNSPAVELMIGINFIPQYRSYSSFRDPNVDELIKRYPKYKDTNVSKELLKDWLREEITLEEIEDALNTKTNYEELLDKLFVACCYSDRNKDFIEYPLSIKKIKLNCQYKRDIDDYIQRNLFSYQQLVRDKKLEPIHDDNPMAVLEYLLQYRAEQKKKEKKAKKKK